MQTNGAAACPGVNFPVLVESFLRRRSAGGRPDRLDDTAIDWVATVRRANEGFAATSLWTALLESGIADRIPADARDYLELVHAENARCNALIRAQCDEIGAALAAAGIEAVLLKGATWLYDVDPRARSDRMLRDLDLLIAADCRDRAMAALASIGFVRSDTIISEDGHVHEAPLVHPERIVSVELHVELTSRARLLPGGDVIASAKSVAPGLRLPSAAHRIVHNVLHAQIVNGDHVGGVVSLRDLLDLARIIAMHGDDIAWDALAREARQAGYCRQLSGALHKAHRFAGAALPAPFAGDRAGRRHAARCAVQRRWPPLGAAMERVGIVARALAWERDSYALGLGEGRGLAAHLKVNRRRAWRIGRAIRRACTHALS